MNWFLLILFLFTCACLVVAALHEKTWVRIVFTVVGVLSFIGAMTLCGMHELQYETACTQRGGVVIGGMHDGYHCIDKSTVR